MLWFGQKVEVGKGEGKETFSDRLFKMAKVGFSLPFTPSPTLRDGTVAEREGGGGEDALTVKSGFSRKGTKREGERSLKRCQCVSGYWNFSCKENDATYQ